MGSISNESFRQIFQSSVEAIIIVDRDGKILLANPVSEVMFAFEKDSLIGVVVEDLLPAHLHTKHVQHRKSFAAHPEPRPMGMGRDLIAKRKDGSQFPVAVSLTYTNIDGEILVMAFISDITERKKSEEAIKKSEEQLLVYASELEKKVQSRTEDLNSTIQALEKEVVIRKRAEDDAKKALDRERELNDLKSKFVTIASHEFRTPLTTISSSASLINQYTKRSEIGKIEKHVLRIKSSVNNLTSILNDFLSLGKLEEGKIDVNKIPFDLQEFLKEINGEITPMLKIGQKLKISCACEMDYIRSDSHVLKNILFNLISNASKYSESNKSIYIDCTGGHNSISFSIRDEGIGIPEEDYKNLFERFFRASNSGNVQGTGLGLNIVKRYADLLGATISFTSEYRVGSVFTILIPFD
jgi:PAS domain S-box-containing protein